MLPALKELEYIYNFLLMNDECSHCQESEVINQKKKKIKAATFIKYK